MKKFFKKIMLAFACFAFGVGISVSPVMAVAEEVETSVEESVETSSGLDTSEEIETSETTSEDVSSDTVDTTFEDFLVWISEVVAKEYGYEYDFAAAIQAIKTAATEKQVTLATITSVGGALLVIILAIALFIRDRKYKEAFIKLSKIFDGKIDNSIKGTNALIDGENTLIEYETANGKTAKETQEEVQSLKRAITAFLSAFLRFTDGIKMGDNKKTEVQSNLLSALKELSTHEGAQDENNKN